jgi:hypothetical protein
MRKISIVACDHVSPHDHLCAIRIRIEKRQTITNRIIVIVPRGERPKVNCRIIYLPEVQ